MMLREIIHTRGCSICCARSALNFQGREAALHRGIIPISPRQHSTKDLWNRIAQNRQVPVGQRAKALNDERLLQCREHGLDGRRFKEPSHLPIDDPDLSERGVFAKLTGHSHDNNIGP